MYLYVYIDTYVYVYTHRYTSGKPHTEFSHFKKKFHFQASAVIKKFKNKIPEKKLALERRQGSFVLQILMSF